MSDPTELTPLRELTTMHVGGPAERLLVATTRDELIAFAQELAAGAHPWCVLGGGSNSVFDESGYAGTVLLVRTQGIEELHRGHADPESVFLRVQAGHGWDALVSSAVDRGLAGIESLSGIPGTAGAAPIQNIGAYGQEVASVLRSIEFVDAETGELEELAASDLGLGYRSSALKHERRGVVVSLVIELTRSDDPLADVRQSVLEQRKSKGMVYDALDPDTHGCGSFFMNPIVSAAFAETLPVDAPRWPIHSDDVTSPVKLSAAWLIEYAGVHKGFTLPGSGAAISTKHALAITNRGGATAQQVAELARFVVQRVQQDTGVILRPEPVAYGIEI